MVREKTQRKKLKKIISGVKHIDVNADTITYRGGNFYYPSTCNAKIFNFGWFDLQAFEQFTQWEGPIVKAKTPKEVEACKYYMEIGNHEWFWRFEYDHKNYRYLRDYQGQAWFKPVTRKNYLKWLSHMADSMYTDMQLLSLERYMSHDCQCRKDNEAILYGQLYMLHNQGITFHGANNLPEDPFNYNWARDLVKSYNIYRYFTEVLNRKLPDFELINNIYRR